MAPVGSHPVIDPRHSTIPFEGELSEKFAKYKSGYFLRVNAEMLRVEARGHRRPKKEVPDSRRAYDGPDLRNRDTGKPR